MNVVPGRAAALALTVAGLSALACSTASENPTAGPAGECAACHLPEYEATRHPIHVGAKPTTCGTCHGADAWHPSVVRHAWPLTGAHATASCFYCHDGTPPVFRGTPQDCVGCHRKDYDASRFPGHSGFPTTCADCHSTNAWKPAAKPAAAPAASAPEPSPAATKPAIPRRSVSPPRPTSVPTAAPPSPPPRPAPSPDSVSGASRHSRGR